MQGERQAFYTNSEKGKITKARKDENTKKSLLLFHGLLVLDKPSGRTSRDAVNRAQGWFPPGTRIGHTGTLDPLATGVLVLGVGAGTRLTEYVQRMSKTYRAGLRLGARSDTDDADGTIAPVPGAQPPDRAAVVHCLSKFVGEVEQVPPAHSAVKAAGRRAYELARRGQPVALQPRRVQVYGIDLIAYDYPRLELEVRCGKGTYIRSLARDLGERLGCGALVETLRRTQVGPFTTADALSLDADTALAVSRLLPLSTAVIDLPRVTLEPADIARLRQGQSVRLSSVSRTGEVAVFDAAGDLVAVALADPAEGVLLPAKVLPVEKREASEPFSF